MAKPVAKRQQSHEVLRVTINDVAFGGDGVTHLPDGKVCFVPGALKGEDIDIVLIDERKTFSFGRMQRIHKASPDRREPGCEHFGNCGGCQYWHVDYPCEVEMKAKQLKDILQRISKIEVDVEAVASPQSEGYRHSLTLHKTKAGKVGFVSTDQKSVVDIKDCPIAHPKLNQLLAERPEDMMRLAVPDVALKTDGQEVSTLRQPVRLSYQYGDHVVHYDVRCFFQANLPVLTQMIDWMRSHLQPTHTLFDLYCGVGVFAMSLSDLFTRVVGMEHSRRSVQFGQFNTQNLENVEVLKGKVEEKFPRICKRYQGASNTVILDPPRMGLETAVIEDLLGRKSIDQILYCSCEPTILARDLNKLLKDDRYRVEKVALFDMFPRTKHFETLILLKKNH